MDWLTRLPVVGPWTARALRTHAWRAFDHLRRAQWSRLAAAITFSSFMALFPLLTVSAAIGAALLPPGRLHIVEQRLAQQVPGLSQRLDVSGLAANAGTVGLVAGALLFLTGIGWVAQLRGCLRAVWGLEPDQDNPVKRKAVDGLILLGLVGVGLVSVGCSAFAATAVGWAAGQVGLATSGVGSVPLTAAGYLVAMLADFLLLAYLLTWLTGVHPPRRSVVVAGLLGAAGLELLKVLLGGYLQGVAAKSMYGAFGTPVALLLWMDLVAKLLLFCSAWTATEAHEASPRPQENVVGGTCRLPATSARRAPTRGGGGDRETEAASAGARTGPPRPARPAPRR